MKRPAKNPTPSRSVLNNERGITLVFVAMLLVVLMGMAALAVDLGMLLNARAEVQRVADSAALAGASALIDSPGDSAGAVARATDYASRNDVRRLGIVLEPGDVDVELWRDRVRVRAYRTTDRGTGLANLFARALGFEESGVSAVAAAEAAAAGGVHCILPFALMDRWRANTVTPPRLATQEDPWDEDLDEYNFGPFDRAPDTWTTGENTGYGIEDRGTILRIYPKNPQDAPRPGWWFTVGTNNANIIKGQIEGCQDQSSVTIYNDTIDIKNGAAVGPIRQGFQNLIGQDLEARWVDSGPENPGIPEGGCVVRNIESGCIFDSPRIRPMPLIQPDEAPLESNEKYATVRNFVGVFVICYGILNSDNETCSSPNSPDAGAYVRFMEYRGVDPMSPDEAPEGSLIRVLRLIE